jgi:hypothetical protein
MHVFYNNSKLANGEPDVKTICVCIGNLCMLCMLCMQWINPAALLLFWQFKFAGQNLQESTWGPASSPWPTRALTLTAASSLSALHRPRGWTASTSFLSKSLRAWMWCAKSGKLAPDLAGLQSRFPLPTVGDFF